MEKSIIITNVSKTFTDEEGTKTSALADISLEIKKGEFFVLLGPSGCGKSTLLRIISGLEKEFQGKVDFAEKLGPGDVGFVFQEFALFPWLTVYENIELSLLSGSLTQSERKKMVLAEIERFGLSKFEKSYPRELSGGMKQRVGIARAWVSNPKIIFMDEAFSELDSFTAEDLRREVLDIWSERKPTIVMVTHLIQEAIELSDRIAVMTKRPGQIEALIENDLERPRNKRSEKFFDLEDRLAKTIKP
jgi:ABC-type nitrate/sulfonate/bicarbonate transport system ATPase subunit